jgi:hypothetical protein
MLRSRVLRRPLSGGAATTLVAAALLALPIAAGTAQADTPLGFSAYATVDTPAAPQAATDLTTADVNRDGHPDILVASQDGDSGATPSGLVSVYLGSATAAPTHVADYPAGTRAYGIAAGDITGDGWPDIVTTSFDGLNILGNNGNGTFGAPFHVAASGNLRQPVLVDVDEDGHLDIAVADYFHDAFLGSIDVFHNDFNGNFPRTRIELGANTNAQRLAAGDVNGDGHVDLIAVNGAAWITLGDGHGGFGAPYTLSWQYTTSLGTPNFSADFQGVTVGDFNGDGRPDVAAASTNDSGAGLWFFPGAASGGLDLANAVSRRVNDSALSLTSADVDGDGRLDVVMTGGNGAYAPIVVNVRTGTDPWPTLGYYAGGAYHQTNYPYPSPVAVDLSGDGEPDLATLDNLNGKLVFRRQQPPDVVPPVVTGTPDRSPDFNGWYTANVTITWTAVDPEPSSGTPTQPGPTLVSFERANLTPQSDYSTDPAGNSAFGTYTLSLDKTPPSISLSTPADGASFVQGSTVNASYSCSDAVSGVAGCVGDVASGAALDTSTVGSHTFTVTATDNAGWSTNQQVSYNVTAPVPNGSASGTLPATGGSISTDTGAGATADAPVQTALTSPVGGAVTIDASGTVTTTAPSTYDLLGQQVQIEAPAASVTQPLILTFTVDASKLGLQPDGSFIDASNLTVFRNGVPISNDCDPGSPGQAVPDPCVLSRATNGDGDAVISVLSSHASTWNFGHRKVFQTSSPFYGSPINATSTNVAKAGSLVPLKFSLHGYQGLAIFAAGFPTSVGKGPCGAPPKVKPLPAGTSSAVLSYDRKSDQYTYSWKTSGSWAGTCRQFNLRLVDGTDHNLSFAFIK